MNLLAFTLRVLLCGPHGFCVLHAISTNSHMRVNTANILIFCLVCMSCAWVETTNQFNAVNDGPWFVFESGKTMLDITTPSNAQISLAQAGCGASMAGGQGGVPKAATDGEWSLVFAFLNLQNQVFPVLDFFKKNIDIFFETNWPNF